MVEPETRGSWYRWAIVVVSFFVMIFTWGTPYSFGVFYAPLEYRFGFSTLQISLLYSTMLFSLYILAGVIGMFASKLRIRLILIVGSLLVGFCAIGFWFVSSYLTVVLVFVTLGTVLGAGYVLLVGIIPMWFSSREATAMGIVFAGNGLGVQVMPTVWQRAITMYGLARAFLVINLVTAVCFLGAGIVVHRPRNPEVQMDYSSVSVVEWIYQLIGRPRFWAAFFGTGLLFAWYYLLAAQAIPFFHARGADRGTAALLYGLIGGISVPTRIVSGIIADHVGARKTIVVSTTVVGTAFFLLIGQSWTSVYLSIILFGVGLGVAAPLYLPALMEGFKVPNQTAFVGLFNFAFAAFAFSVPLVSVFIIQHTGGFDIVMLLMGGLTIGGAIIFWIGTAGLEV